MEIRSVINELPSQFEWLGSRGGRRGWGIVNDPELCRPVDTIQGRSAQPRQTPRLDRILQCSCGDAISLSDAEGESSWSRKCRRCRVGSPLKKWTNRAAESCTRIYQGDGKLSNSVTVNRIVFYFYFYFLKKRGNLRVALEKTLLIDGSDRRWSQAKFFAALIFDVTSCGNSTFF